MNTLMDIYVVYLLYLILNDLYGGGGDFGKRDSVPLGH